MQTESHDTGYNNDKPVCVHGLVVMRYLWKWTGVHP